MYQFIDLVNILLKPGGRYEDLYQRIVSFFDDSLLTAGTLTHHGEPVTIDEELSPSLGKSCPIPYKVNIAGEFFKALLQISLK